MNEGRYTLNAGKLMKIVHGSYNFMLSLIFLLFNTTAYADNVDDFLLKKMNALNIPGLQIAVVKDHKIVKTANYGIANIQDSVKVDKNTVFNIASMTKAFTCVAVMQLVEQGKIDLGATIA